MVCQILRLSVIIPFNIFWIFFKQKLKIENWARKVQNLRNVEIDHLLVCYETTYKNTHPQIEISDPNEKFVDPYFCFAFKKLKSFKELAKDKRRLTRERERGRSPLPFPKLKKNALILEKKCPDYIHHLWVKFLI